MTIVLDQLSTSNHSDNQPGEPEHERRQDQQRPRETHYASYIRRNDSGGAFRFRYTLIVARDRKLTYLVRESARTPLVLKGPVQSVEEVNFGILPDCTKSLPK